MVINRINLCHCLIKSIKFSNTTQNGTDTHTHRHTNNGTYTHTHTHPAIIMLGHNCVGHLNANPVKLSPATKMSGNIWSGTLFVNRKSIQLKFQAAFMLLLLLLLLMLVLLLLFRLLPWCRLAAFELNFPVIGLQLLLRAPARQTRPNCSANLHKSDAQLTTAQSCSGCYSCGTSHSSTEPFTPAFCTRVCVCL